MSILYIAISWICNTSYSDDATFWFAQVNAFFQVHEILQERHLTLLLCGMPPSLAKTVREIITSPPPDITYQTLKAEVLKRNTASAGS